MLSRRRAERAHSIAFQLIYTAGPTVQFPLPSSYDLVGRVGLVPRRYSAPLRRWSSGLDQVGSDVEGKDGRG